MRGVCAQGKRPLHAGHPPSLVTPTKVGVQLFVKPAHNDLNKASWPDLIRPSLRGR